MRKQILPEDVKLVATSAAFNKEDFGQLIVPAAAAGDIVLTSGALSSTMDGPTVTIKVAEDQVGINVQFDLEGVEQYVTITGADNAILATKAAVDEVRGHANEDKINPVSHSVKRY